MRKDSHCALQGCATRGNTVRLLRHTACFGCADPRLVPDVETAQPLPTLNNASAARLQALWHGALCASRALGAVMRERTSRCRGDPG